MAKKPLTVERVLELLYYDGADLRWLPRKETTFRDKAWNTKYADKIAGALNQKGYRQICIDGPRYYISRLVWFIHHGYFPEQVDHENRDKLDNRLENLRSVSTQVNCRNRSLRSDNKSGVNGVFFRKRANAYYATISDGSKIVHIGQFKELQDAADARKKWMDKLGYHENHGKASSL